ncbi:hypothetical protein EHS13_24195 [Paenibacillus psychroresistens]|uniref:Uncharacterized protein n=1 Tax=Paenibacillus psychroresistens TaxID=1778678 RepID=A0A6B8RPJ7_9BACL|nr:hypothetical protein [Paenibacillus psychroresistens]QGQ97767.1 hypothetical protein EHS13_24195 [Paenibacillus psychroresistens]
MKLNKYMNKTLVISIAFTMLLISALFIGPSHSAHATAVTADTVGVTHVKGLYNFASNKDFLNEGADELLSMGTKVIKLFFTPTYATDYPFNSSWGTYTNMKALAQSTYFSTVFNKSFNTFILEAYEFTSNDFTDGMTATEVANVKDEFYQLTKYLMQTYQGTGKTFILQQWEGDNAICYPAGTCNPGSTAIQGMIDWLNARQDGITQARTELSTTTGVHVYGAAEVNKVTDARLYPSDMTKGNATNRVIPSTHMDLYSYSMYDAGFPANTSTIISNLDYLKLKAPDSSAFGANNLYLGEFGLPENDYLTVFHKQNAQSIIETSLNWGVNFAVFWQLYDNEPKTTFTGRPTNSDTRGFWLVRPNTTKTEIYDYLKGIFTGKSIITDDLNDWAKSYSHSANWVMDTVSASSYFEYDASRAKRTSNTTENIIYNKLNISDFLARIYYTGTVSGKVKFYASPDNSTWTLLSTTNDTPVSTSSGWYRTYFKPSGSIPAGTNFFKVELSNDANIFTPQLSEISLSYTPNNFTDDLNNWSNAYSHTANWAFDTSSALYFETDSSRTVRTTDTAENVIYNKTNMTDFSIRVYYYTSISGKLNIYTSPNGTTWTAISTSKDIAVPTSSGWYRTLLRPSGGIPSGTNYLKVEILNDANIWTPELSQVKITY